MIVNYAEFGLVNSLVYDEAGCQRVLRFAIRQVTLSE